MVNSYRPKRMDELFITILFFIFIFSCHIVLHRLLALWNVRTIRSLWCYIFGGMLLIVCSLQGLLAYPVSAFCLYVLLSIGISILYTSFFLGAQTPAAIILDAFFRRNKQTSATIASLFAKNHLFEKRVRNLLAWELVRKKGNRVCPTAKGHWIALIITWYQRVFNRPTGG